MKYDLYKEGKTVKIGMELEEIAKGADIVQKKELEQYRNIQKEIKHLEEQIKKEAKKEIPVLYGTVKGSMHDFPYIEKRTVVQMYEPTLSDEKNKLMRIKQQKKQELERVAYETESYINEIPDSELRTMFRLRYIDGMTQSEIADYINLDRSRVSRKISNYIKTHTKHKKSVL